MKRGVRQFWQPRYTKFIGFGVFSLGMAFLPGSQVFAATESITHLVVKSQKHEVTNGSLASTITLELQNANNEPESLDDVQGVTVVAKSSSESGAFFNANEVDSTNLAFESGASQITLLYKDSVAANHTLTFSVAREGIDLPPLEHALRLNNPIATITPFESVHDTRTPIIVRGTVDRIPQDVTVWVALKKPTNEVVGEQKVVTDRGAGIKLAELPIPNTLADGMYTIELTAMRGTESIIDPQIVEIMLQRSTKVPTEPSPQPPATEQDPNPKKEPGLPVIKSETPIETIEPITKLALSSNFSSPLTATSSSTRNFINATSRSSASAASTRSSSSKDDDGMQKSEIRGVKDSEQSITLQSSSDDKAVVEASEEGWRFFGAPWYWWGGGTAALYGAWFGARRLIGGTE